MVASSSHELPFGKGKSFAQSGVPAAILGDWQINALASLYTGRPAMPIAPGGSLSSVGSGQFADCLSAPVKLGSPDRWWDPSTMADPGEENGPPRFVMCGSHVLRGPGLINLDMGVFRKFQPTERLSIQFRGEISNVSNTPHFANPNSNIAGSGFGIVNNVANTGREGLDQRVFRMGLRLAF